MDNPIKPGMLKRLTIALIGLGLLLAVPSVFLGGGETFITGFSMITTGLGIILGNYIWTGKTKMY